MQRRYVSSDELNECVRVAETALQIGLIASPTPFATGRPHTLLSGKNIYSDGAVGIATCRYPTKFNAAEDVQISYSGLEPLGGSLEVTA